MKTIYLIPVAALSILIGFSWGHSSSNSVTSEIEMNNQLIIEDYYRSLEIAGPSGRAKHSLESRIDAINTLIVFPLPSERMSFFISAANYDPSVEIRSKAFDAFANELEVYTNRMKNVLEKAIDQESDAVLALRKESFLRKNSKMKTE